MVTLALAIAMAAPHVLLARQLGPTWKTAGLASLYVAVATNVTAAWESQGIVSTTTSELIAVGYGGGWFGVIVWTVHSRMRARRRVARIRHAWDASTVPDTIPEWMQPSAADQVENGAVQPTDAPARAGRPRKVISLKFTATCGTCHSYLPPGSDASWDKDEKVATCVVCAHGDAVAPAAGRAGGSARRMAISKEARGRRDFTAWKKGADGEERIGLLLQQLESEGCCVLHDRNLPESPANIDHLVVTPAGVWVVDAKNYSGVPAFAEVAGSSAGVLTIDGRPQHELIEGAHRQIAAVRAAGGDILARDDVSIHGVLCFVGPTAELLVRPMTVSGIGILWPGLLLEAIRSAPGPLDEAEIRGIAARLHNGLRHRPRRPAPRRRRRDAPMPAST